MLRCVSTGHTKLGCAALHQSEQRKTEQNGAKLRLLALKKNPCSSMRKIVLLFVRKHLKKKNQRRHWVTPLFESGISLDIFE